jgi:TPR repeat protein
VTGARRARVARVAVFRLSVLACLAVVAGLFARPAWAAEPAEDTFQRGIQVYQSGDRAAAFRLFMSAANAGNSKAAVQTGWSYEFGAGVPRDLAQAARWYRKAAEQGNARGQKNLGSLYESGRGVPENWVEAAKWYRKSAEQGNAEGQAALARAYAFGIGVPQSRRAAIEWDTRAAAQGNQESAYYARWLSNPTNNIGFRNVQERNLVVGYRMVDMVVHNEPVGRLFRNSGERHAYLVGVARRLDTDMAYARWWRAQSDYTRCEAERRGGCQPPGPAPR